MEKIDKLYQQFQLPIISSVLGLLLPLLLFGPNDKTLKAAQSARQILKQKDLRQFFTEPRKVKLLVKPLGSTARFTEIAQGQLGLAPT